MHNHSDKKTRESNGGGEQKKNAEDAPAGKSKGIES